MEALLKIDVGILLFLQEYVRNDGLTPIIKFITEYGSFTMIALGVILMIFGKRKYRIAGIVAVLAVVLDNIIVTGIKNVLARPRPYITFPEVIPMVGIPSKYSFPSGHTGFAFSVALSFCKYLPKKYCVISLVISALVGFSRLYLGVHYPSDVLAGVVVGFVASGLAYYIVEFIREKIKK